MKYKIKYSQINAYETQKEEAPSPELIAKLTREKNTLTGNSFLYEQFSTL